MKSILTELYEGNIFPAEQYSPRSEEYRQIHQSHYKHYDNFIETLSKLEPPLDKQFIKIMDEQLDVIPYEFSEMFIDGFRLGARKEAYLWTRRTSENTQSLCRSWA